jgi:hypothetical protein
MDFDSNFKIICLIDREISPSSLIQSRIVLPNQALQYLAFGNCCKAYLFLEYFSEIDKIFILQEAVLY